MSNRKLTSSQLKKFRSDVAKLKSKGLVSKKTDARSQKPTRYMLSQVKKYDDVLSGKAKVGHASSRKAAKEFAENYRVKGKAVVIPAKADEHVSYSKKTNSFSASRKTKGGKKVTRHLYADASKRKPPAGTKGKDVLFVIPFANGSRQTFDTWEDLVLFMNPYEMDEKKPFRDWEKYVEIVSVEDADDA